MRSTTFFAILFALFCVTSIHSKMISSTNFEDWKKGEPTSMSLFQEKGFQTGTWENSLEERTLIDTMQSASGTQSMRITYPTGGVGPDETGCQIQLKFEKRDEAFASYYLRFSEDFTWGTTSYGGKLPGLAGGNCCSGGASCDGTNGFSARLMWRTGGKGVLYLYHMDKPATYGEDHNLIYPDGSHVNFERGKWYHIAERVKCNTDGDTYDGEVEIWVDGKQVLLLKGLRFTSNGDKVDDLYISTFHGGNDDTWAPTDTCYTWLDDIRIGTTYEDVAYQECAQPQLGEDKTLCTGAKSVRLAAQTTSSNTRHTWLFNHTIISQKEEINVWNPGTYTLITDSGWCSRRDSVKLLGNLQTDIEKEMHICNQSFATIHTHLAEGGDITFQWKKDGETLQETGNQLTVKDAGTYQVTISSPLCKSVTSTIKVTSGLLSIRDTFGKEGEEVNLRIPEEGSYLWYEDNEESQPIGSGSTFTTTIAGKNRYLYVKDANSFSGYAGKKELTGNAYTRSNFATEWMLFTVHKTLTIDSITIYPVKNQTVVIRILDDATETVLFSKTYEQLEAGTNRLAIGATLSPGKYRMDANGTTGSLYHSYADEDIQFPYTIDGLLSIDGCNLAWINNKPWYLFFYNWKISAGNVCAATPVLLRNVSATAVTEVTDATIDVHPKFTDGELNIDGMRGRATVTIFSANGKKVLSLKSRHPHMYLNVETWKAGIYMLIIEDERGRFVTRFMKL